MLAPLWVQCMYRSVRKNLDTSLVVFTNGICKGNQWEIESHFPYSEQIFIQKTVALRVFIFILMPAEICFQKRYHFNFMIQEVLI